jgi:TfoX/Sxy family transcriptional regulator of competence genes
MEIAMATDLEFIQYVCEQISDTGRTRYRKMFGEYMVYVNDKPILLVCDNTVYIKQHECLEELMKESEKGSPYTGAKEHYIVDIDNRELCSEIIKLIEPLVKVPKSKNSIKKG